MIDTLVQRQIVSTICRGSNATGASRIGGLWAAYLCAAKVRLVDFAQHTHSLTERLLQETQKRAADAQRPYHFLRSTQISKEQFVEDIAP